MYGSYSDKEDSPRNSWKRCLTKYDVSKAHLLSPIKPTIANYEPVLLNNEYNNGLLWILIMSEKLYYDNSCLLCFKHFENIDKLKNMLQRNTKEVLINDLISKWTKITAVGSGSFGLVVKVETEDDDVTGVKYVKREREVELDLISFITERNYLIRASKSPFVVRILHTFQIRELSGLFLVMEYCISDLQNVLDAFLEILKPNSYQKLIERDHCYFKTLYQRLDKKFKLDIKRILTIHIFELFAILDHLANCNIVHCDLKPANIMISDRFHLKVGDLGLVNNTHHITERNRHRLFHHKKVIEQQSDKYAVRTKGTRVYTDPEVSFKKMPASVFMSVFNDVIDSHRMLDEDNAQNFLYDLWSMGEIAAELLLMGFNIFNPLQMRNCNNFDFKSAINYSSEYLMLLFTIVPDYHQYIEPGFDKAFNGMMGDVPKFIGSILNYRSARCPEYLKTKTILVYSRHEVYKCIDISKVEQIDLFKHYDINSSNAFLFDIPSNFQYLIPEPDEDSVFENFDEYIEDLMDEENGNYDGYLRLQPGLNLDWNE